MAEIATFMEGRKSESPKALYIASQPGGGKTGLKIFLLNEESKKGNYFIEFNPDEIAIYHKYYREILEEYPNESYKKLQKFVSPALDNYLRKRAVELRYNVLQEGTFGSTEGYIKAIEFQKNGGVANIGNMESGNTRQAIKVNGGYNIDRAILAVDRFESLLSSFEREQYFEENNLPPRGVTIENHDRAYNNMLTTIGKIEEGRLYDRIRVYKRGYNETQPELVFILGDKKYMSATEAIRDIRKKNRKELLENSERYFDRINKLRAKAKSPVLLEKLDQLEAEFRQELGKTREGKGEEK